mgnify:FL=1
MGMRLRYDDKGKIIGAHNMVFDDMPDDYRVQNVLIDGGVQDLSYTAFMKQLRNAKVADEFEDNGFYSKEILSHLAIDYLYSALYLQKGIMEDRKENGILSLYIIPCAYLCKHSVELKIKECLLEKYGNIENTHSIIKLWSRLNEKTILHYEELNSFINELEAIDRNEMALRYGVSVKLEPLQENFMFDVDSLLSNTKFFFNVVDEHIICKYRHKPKEK